MNRIYSLCVAIALAGFALPLAAQQTIPDEPVQQTPPSVPPAPPPGSPSTPEGLPPFPPMPSRPPEHRWVDMGGSHSSARAHRSSAHKATAHSRHRTIHEAKSAHHRLTRTEKNIRYCDNLSHRRSMHNRTCVALMKKQKASEGHHRLTRAEKNIRYCDSLSHRRMMHNRTCVALMKTQGSAKHRAKSHKANAHKSRKKTTTRKTSRHTASVTREQRTALDSKRAAEAALL